MASSNPCWANGIASGPLGAVNPTNRRDSLSVARTISRGATVSQQEVITDDFTGYGQSVSIPMPKPEDIVNAR
jgi:hypothetical protein